MTLDSSNTICVESNSKNILLTIPLMTMSLFVGVLYFFSGRVLLIPFFGLFFLSSLNVVYRYFHPIVWKTTVGSSRLILLKNGVVYRELMRDNITSVVCSLYGEGYVNFIFDDNPWFNMPEVYYSRVGLQCFADVLDQYGWPVEYNR